MTAQKQQWVKWTLFVALCVIWGSSFILMKEGMKALSAYQVAAIRILSAGLVLLPVVIKNLRAIPINKIVLILVSGLLGSFFPAFLFCIAETHIDSSLAGFLNALTPILTIFIGMLFYQVPLEKKRLPGVLIGFAGMLLIFLATGSRGVKEVWYAALVLIATISYAVNVNMVGRYLKKVGSINIAAFAFVMLIIPSMVVLIFTGFFNLHFGNKLLIYSTLASVVLGVMGTAVASILFYILLRRAGQLFSSMVTYGIPFVGLFWGFLAGETVMALQIVGLGVIFIGVFLTSKPVNGKLVKPDNMLTKA